MGEERRLVTVLFADVVGSTALGDSLDPEDLRRLLGRYYEVARQVVEAHDGTLEKFMGDAALAIFGLPQAHDDDARRALDSALELAARVREDAALGDRLPIRIGINTGEVVASRDRDRSDFIITGDAVNVAARLQQVAEPWQILASGRTASAAAGAYDFGPPQDMELKGKSTPVVARALLGPSTPSQLRTPLVGRDADIAQLELVARRAFTERRPYLVSLIAPAGTGKSRLVEEFLHRMPTFREDVRVAVAQCLPYGQRLTYWPMRALLLGLLGIDGDDALADEIRGATRSWLDAAGAENPAELTEVLAATIGASDTDILDRGVLFSAWRSTLELAASQQPLVLLIEDLHWSSDSLLDLIEFILQPRTDAPMLMLALTRPELLERRPTWGGGRRNHISLALQPLDEDSIKRLVEYILEGPAPDLVRFVSERSEGNPFYAGEMVRSLIERGVDVRDPIAVAAGAAALPDTVQATVLARLDALDPIARRVIQLGSAFGRGFSVAGIVAIDPELADDATPAVDRLIDREFLRPAGRDALAFRHILIRDVAYGTLPRAERAVHHAAAGRWLESTATGREDELAELVAFHYREAAVLAEAFGEVEPATKERAVAWLRRAAEVAAGARGVIEAIGHLRAAIDLAPTADQPELYQRLGQIYGSGDNSVQAFSNAWKIGQRAGRPIDFLLDNLAHELMVTCRWFASVADQPPESEITALVEQGQAWLPDAGPRASATFLIAFGFLPFWLRNGAVRPVRREDVDAANASIQAGLALAEELDDPILISAALDGMTSELQSSDPGASRVLSERRVALGSRLSLDERLDALNMVAWSSAHLGDLEKVVESSDAAMTLVQPGETAGFAVGGASWNAYAHAVAGHWDPLVRAVEQLRNRWEETERPAAAYALQGLLSGIDWARNRGEVELLEAWRAVAIEIIGRFGKAHPVSALQAMIQPDIAAVADLVRHHTRHPNRQHYIEHAIALCADRAQPVAMDTLDEILDQAGRSGMRLLEAQAQRLRGITRSSADDLAASLRIFGELGAGRYVPRVQSELGQLAGDEAMLAAGRAGLDRLGELDKLKRMTSGR